MARVLVIDDCPDHLDWTRCALQAEGVVVIEARDALAGLQYAVEGTPDMVVVSESLGGLDGLDVVARITSEPESRGIPVLLSVEAPDPALRQAAKEAGAEGVLLRSYRRADLVGPVRERLSAAGITWMVIDRNGSTPNARVRV